MTDLNHLEELCAKNTGKTYYTTQYEITHPYDKDKIDLEDLLESVSWTISQDPDDTGWETDAGCDGYGLTHTDAQYFVTVLNSFPSLLAEVRRLEDQCKRLKDYDTRCTSCNKRLFIGEVSLYGEHNVICTQCTQIIQLEASMKDATEALERITDATPSMGRPEFTMYDLRDIARTCLVRIKGES